MRSFDPDAYPLADFGLRCDCGYPLANLTEHRCPECGSAFTLDQFIPQGAMPVLIADAKQVRATPETVDLLRRYRIPFAEQETLFTRMLGSKGPMLSRESSAPIMVPRDRFLEAIDLLRRQKFGEPMPEPPAPPETDPPEWICPRCQQPNPGNFEVCWNCS